MASFSRVLKELPPDSRNRVVNWISSQDWSDEQDSKPADTRQTTIPALS